MENNAALRYHYRPSGIALTTSLKQSETKTANVQRTRIEIIENVLENTSRYFFPHIFL